MSFKDFNPKTIEMDIKEEMSSEENSSGEEFIHETDETLIVDEIEIKYEDMDYHVHHNSTAQAHSHLDDLETSSNLTGPSSSSIQIKSEVEENITKRSCSVSEEVSAPCSDSHPDYNVESDSGNDPDFAPSLSLTRKLRRHGHVSVKSDTSSQSGSFKSKKENLPSREHFKCGECDKSFKRMIRLKEHMRVHTGERPFKCDVCEKGFARSSDLTVHKRIHTGEKPFKCDLCVKAFVRSHDLTVHKRIHTGEKPLKCDVCIRSFSQRTDLRRHKMIHTGEKPFTCDVCEKSFATLNILTGHKGIHTGEKPYACNVCDKGFTTRSTLAVHTRIHTGDKPFKCDVCAKSFSQKTNLISHKGIHTGERPYQCDQCEKSFILKSHRTAHKNKSH